MFAVEMSFWHATSPSHRHSIQFGSSGMMTRYHFSFPNAKNFMNETHSARKHVRVKKSLPLESKVRNKKEKKTLIAV